MKRVKQIRIWHENSEGKVTQEFEIFINRGVPGSEQHVHITESGIRAGNALRELSINKHVMTITEKRPYHVTVERFSLLAEPKFYNIFDAAQGALEFANTSYATIYLGMFTVKIDPMTRTLKLSIWENAKIEML